MKILILTNYASVYGGNFIPSISNLAKYSIGCGDQIGFALSEKAREREWCTELENKYQLLFLGNRSTWENAKILNQHIKDNKYDVLYTHFSYFNLACTVSLINRKIAYVCHKHTDIGSELTLKRRVKILMKKALIYRNMTSIYVSQSLQKAELMEKAKNAFWVPNALAASRFDLTIHDELRKNGRQEYGIPQDGIVILMFGWHHHVKGVDIAVQAFETLLSSGGGKAKLCIVTSSAKGAEGTLQDVLPLVGKDTIENIIFLPPIQDVQKYHAMADVFLSSSRSEGFSYSILEALYLGETVVTSILEGTSWSLKFKTVHGFESENIEDCSMKLADAIQSIRDINAHKQKYLEARKIILSEMGIEMWSKRIYEILYKAWEENNR